MTDAVSRRGVLAGAAALGTVAVTGCGGGSDDDTGAAPTPTATPTGTPTSASPTTGAAAPLAKLADIAVGSAVSVKNQNGQTVIVARPTSTTAAAFDPTCTHKGCTVRAAGTELRCPCHGSRYAAATGKVLKGPADAPLKSIPVTVANGNVLPA